MTRPGRRSRGGGALSAADAAAAVGVARFGTLQAGLYLSYSPTVVSFAWGGCDEMDEVTGAALIASPIW
jgi:hypothetical protein